MKAKRTIRNYVVYFHRNPISGRPFYVGVGTIKRANNLYPSCRNKFWRNYVGKYGTPIVEIVHMELSAEEACYLERKYIMEFGRRGLDSGGILVNKSEGGDLAAAGFRHTEEARKKISDALKKRRPLTEDQKRRRGLASKGLKRTEPQRLKNSLAKRGEKHPNYGKHLSEETRLKIGDANRGRIFDSRKVINIETKEVFPSAHSVAKRFYPNEHPNTFSAKLRGAKSNHTKFQFLDDYEAGVPIYKLDDYSSKPKMVRNVLSGEVYSSIEEAGRANGVSGGAVRFHLSGRPRKSKPKFELIN